MQLCFLSYLCCKHCQVILTASQTQAAPRGRLLKDANQIVSPSPFRQVGGFSSVCVCGRFPLLGQSGFKKLQFGVLKEAKNTTWWSDALLIYTHLTLTHLLRGFLPSPLLLSDCSSTYLTLLAALLPPKPVTTHDKALGGP